MYIAKEIKEIEGITDAAAIELQRRANRVARQNGCGYATSVKLGKSDRVIEHIHYGYRKITTGQYVPTAYRSNFGWKNTYYQSAETTVEIALFD